MKPILDMPVSSRVDKDTFDEIQDVIYEDDNMGSVSDFVRIAIEYYLQDDEGTINNRDACSNDKRGVLSRIGIRR